MDVVVLLVLLVVLVVLVVLELFAVAELEMEDLLDFVVAVEVVIKARNAF